MIHFSLVSQFPEQFERECSATSHKKIIIIKQGERRLVLAKHRSVLLGMKSLCVIWSPFLDRSDVFSQPLMASFFTPGEKKT